MPSLKDVTCSIELPQSKQTLREFGTAYSDGVVETFVAVPSEPNKFAIRLTSNGYIADGLAMYVYIDGVYQCNRNRLDMKELAAKGKRLEFLVRQKEEKQKDGRIIAREWTFGKLNIVSADQAPQQCSPNAVDNIGCIEVIVLRCKGFRIPRPAKCNMGFDGSYDSPDDYFGMDGQPQGWGFDDRTVLSPHIRGRARTQDGVINGKRQSFRASRPPPPLARRSYSPGVASRFGGHVIIPEGAYQYGSDPVLRQPHAEPDMELFADRTARNIAGHDIVNPEWLKRIREEAYHRGLREAELKKLREEPGRHYHGLQYPPGNVPPPRPPAYEHAGAHPVSPNPENLRSRQAGTPGNPWNLTINQTWDKHQGWPGEDKPSGWQRPTIHGNDSDSWATSAWELDAVSPPPPGHVSQSRSVASTTHQHGTKSKRSRHASKFGGAPTVQTIPESPTWGDGANESWDSSKSVWTDSTIISPREHISRAQAGRPRRNMADFSETWTSAPSQEHVQPPLNAPTAKYSSHYFNMSSQLPPIPVPLDFRGKTNVRPCSPPPPYPDVPVHLFRTASKTSVVTNEPLSAAKKSTKLGKPAWPWAMTTTAGTHVQPGSVSKQKTVPSHASSVWTTNEGSPDTKPDEIKRWDSGSVRMPGSWNDGEESKEKPNHDDGWGKDWNFASAGQTQSRGGWEQGGENPSKDGTAEKKDDSGWNNDKNEPSWNQTNNNAETPAWNQSCDAEKKSDWNNDNNQNEDVAKASEKAWNAEDNTKQNETTGDTGWANDGWGGFPTADDNTPKGEDAAAGLTNTENKDDIWGGFLTADDTPKGEDGAAGLTNTESKGDAQKNDTSGDVNGEWQNNEQNNDAAQPNWENTDNNAAETQENPFADQGWGNGGNDWNIPQANQDAASAKHSTSSARKSRSRHHRRAPSQLGPKSYWVFPPPAPSTSTGMRKLYPIPEDQESTLPGSIAKDWVLPPEPLPPIPEDKAKEKGLSHQVQPGEGMRYTHAVGRPEYMDGFERPYAVFRFKYRSRKELKRLFGEDVPDEENGLVVQSEDGKEREKQEKEKLKVLSEEEKVEEILRLKKMLEAEKGNAGNKKEQGGEANNFLENWVNDQRERSRKSSEKAESKKSASNKGGEANWGGEWGADQAGSKKSASNKGGEANWGGEWGADQAGSKKAASQQAEWNQSGGSKKSASKASQKAESKKGDNAGVPGEAAWDSGNGGGGQGSWEQDGGGGDGGGDWNNKADAGEPAGVSW